MDKSLIEFSTFIGMLFAALLVLFAIISGGNALGFIDIPAIMIVVIGTFCLTIACFSLKEVFLAQSIIIKSIFQFSEDPVDTAKRALTIAVHARKDGILSLQKQQKIFDGYPLLSKAVEMLLDNTNKERIEAILTHDINAQMGHNQNTILILRKAAEIAPAMGLIGTLVGLIQMLGNLENPSAIGPAMAVALLTTMYGAILAYMVFTPLASKLERNSKSEWLAADIYIKTANSIANKENPRELERLLNSILPPGKRIQYFG